MAISPLSHRQSGGDGLIRLDNLKNNQITDRRSQNSRQDRLNLDSETLDRRVQQARRSSVLYQVVSKLLLSSKQRSHLDDNFQRQSDATVQTESSGNERNSSAELSISSQTLFVSTGVLSIQFETGGVNLEAEIDGISISAQLDWTIISIEEQQQEADPLVLDLDNNGIQLTSVHDGVMFDLDNDGKLELMSNTIGDDVFLALDLNDNGRIDGANELFGDQTGFKNGFEALKQYDDNADLQIDAQDQIYNRLLTARLIGNEQFIQKLTDHEIESINLDYQDLSNQRSSTDNIVQISDYKAKKMASTIADVMLAYREVDED